jgi:hypothetical protein
MKRILAFLALGAVCAAPLCAQAVPKGIVVDIPFAFYLGDKPCAEGSYRVNEIDMTHSFVLQRREGHPNTLMLQAMPSIWNVLAKEPVAKLVFTKYDVDHTFLSEIWFGDLGPTWTTVKSRTEREHVTSTIITQKAPEIVTILARAVTH